ncbi:hypothetical protein LCGC14_1058870 [marine sediment metagenome]|uniref:Uncharacterized protein n=1 Tax=marine sediment metagenome TaxID=412755 RepID=A0A0F9MRA4_9ZZZZ
MVNDYFKSSKNNISSRRKNQRKKYAVIIISLIVIISLVSIPVVIYAYNTIRNLLNYDPELPCEDLPDIETVRQIVEDHQDVIQEIENTNPNIPERMSSENSFFYPPSSRKLFVI